MEKQTMARWIGLCELVFGIPWGITYFCGIVFLIGTHQYAKVLVAAIFTSLIISLVCALFLWPIVGRRTAIRRKWIASPARYS